MTLSSPATARSTCWQMSLDPEVGASLDCPMARRWWTRHTFRSGVTIKLVSCDLHRDEAHVWLSTVADP